MDEVIKLENKMAFYFKKTEKDIFMAEDDEEVFKNDNCRIYEKIIESDKVRDHCHLTGKNRGPVHKKCSINVKQKQNLFFPIVFPIFSIYDYRPI